MAGQFGIGQLFALAVFADGDHRRMIVATAQQVFGKVQGSAGKPLGAGHLGVFDQYRARWRAELHVEELDDGLPEVRALVDAPLVQGRVVADLQGVAIIDEASELVHPGVVDAFGGGLPEYFGHR